MHLGFKSVTDLSGWQVGLDFRGAVNALSRLASGYPP